MFESGSGPDFIKLVRVRMLPILSPGPNLIKAVRKVSPVPDYINVGVRLRSRFYQTSPGPDATYFESGSESYQGSPEGESGSGLY